MRFPSHGKRLMTAGTALLFILFLRNLKPLYYAIFSFFTVMAQYFGSMLGGYHAISFYDLLLHFSSGILLILVGYLLYTALVRRYEIDSRAVLLPVLFSLFLAMAFGRCMNSVGIHFSICRHRAVR